MSSATTASRADEADGLEEQQWKGRTFITETLLKGLDAVGGLDGRAAVAGVDEQTQAIMLLRKRKDAKTMDEALNATKEDHRQRMRFLDKREEQLSEKLRSLQATVAKFRPFIEENDAKVDKAARKERSEAASISKLEHDIGAVNAETVRMQEDWLLVERDLAHLQQYAGYLQEVKAEAEAGSSGAAERFQDLRDILAR